MSSRYLLLLMLIKASFRKIYIHWELTLLFKVFIFFMLEALSLSIFDYLRANIEKVRWSNYFPPDTVWRRFTSPIWSSYFWRIPIIGFILLFKLFPISSIPLYLSFRDLLLMCDGLLTIEGNLKPYLGVYLVTLESFFPMNLIPGWISRLVFLGRN